MSFNEYSIRLPTHYPSSSATGDNGPTTVGEQNGQSDEKKQDTDSGPSKGFIDIIEYHAEGIGGKDVSIFPTAKFMPKEKITTTSKPKEASENHAVVLRRTWMEHRHVSLLVSIELEIHSKPLCAKFREIAAKCYETTDLQTFPIKIQSPFRELFFYRKEIKALAKDDTMDEDLQKAAKALNEFVHKPNGLMAAIIEDHDRFLKEDKVVNDILWTIYPPNSLLVLNTGVLKECWVSRNVTTMTDAHTKITYWVVTGLRIDFDGISPGLTKQKFYTPMTGMRPVKISELSLIPAQHYGHWESLKARLERRSGTILDALGSKLSSFMCKAYSGPSWSHRSSAAHDGDNPLLRADQIDQRVMVDFKAMSKHDRLSPLEEIWGSSRKKVAVTLRSTARGMVPERNLLGKKSKGQKKDGGKSGSNDDKAESETEQPPTMLEDVEDVMAYRTAEPFMAIDPDDKDKPNLSTLKGVAKAAMKYLHISEEEFGLLFPALVPVFGLRDKKWWWVLSDELRDIEWNRKAFHSLQHDQMTKDMVEALVKGHKSKGVAFDDVIAGKGQGLIFLLYGNPGLGKILTIGKYFSPIYSSYLWYIIAAD
ncbi:hypothetical protein B0T20DRAFT_451525 [Sordaria brevicollis]|uniref:DUF7025 domain-containing protein n=1 Tax=Sordaria brevicollis TaxID=83679 RepID=A0AAE0PJ85_SORBR|nr:hypothetical protein B0T20DRAFT_451525 [Sordaria brevicollis]